MQTQRTYRSSTSTAQNVRPTAPPRRAAYVVAYAKEGNRSSCKICGKGFRPHRLRFGSFFMHRDGSVSLRWHHLRCIRPPRSLEDVTQLTAGTRILPEDMVDLRAWAEGRVLPRSRPSSPILIRSPSPVLLSSVSSVSSDDGFSDDGRASVMTDRPTWKRSDTAPAAESHESDWVPLCERKREARHRYMVELDSMSDLSFDDEWVGNGGPGGRGKREGRLRSRGSRKPRDGGKDKASKSGRHKRWGTV